MAIGEPERGIAVGLFTKVETTELEGGLGVVIVNFGGLGEELDAGVVGGGEESADVALEGVDADGRTGPHELGFGEGFLGGEVVEDEPRDLGLDDAEVGHGAFGGEGWSEAHAFDVDDEAGEAEGGVKGGLRVGGGGSGGGRGGRGADFVLAEDELGGIERLADLKDCGAGEDGVGPDGEAMVDLGAVLA